MIKITRMLFTAFVFILMSANANAIGMKSTSDVKDSIDQTIAQLEKAVAAFEKGENQSVVNDLLMEAKQIQKSISSANGKLSMIKSKATHKLGEARSNFNDGDKLAGGLAMKEALDGFRELRKEYNQMH